MSLPLYVTFSDEPVECAEPNFLQNRDVKLPTTGSSSTSRLHCSGGSFVSSQGEVVVKSEGGAWSAQPTGQCGEHLLRFYLDFPEGAARNDVSLPAGRLYFSSACWDKDERAAAQAEVDILKAEIEGIIDTKDAAADYAKAKGGDDGGDGLSFLESANAFRKAKQRSDKANPLVERYKGMVASLPNEVVSAGQVELLTIGGVSIKGNGAKNLWGVLGDVFLILGRFTISEA